MISRILAWYTRLLDVRPIATKSVTAAVIAMAGDVLCQVLQDHRARSERAKRRMQSDDSVVYDAEAASVSVGDTYWGSLHAPLPRVVNIGMLAVPIPASLAWWDVKRTARMGLYSLAVTPAVHYWYGWLQRTFPVSPMKRMLSDQLFWTPVTLVAFLVTMGIAEHGTREAGAAKLRVCFVQVLKSNYMLWPAVQYVNLVGGVKWGRR